MEVIVCYKGMQYCENTILCETICNVDLSLLQQYGLLARAFHLSNELPFL